MSTPIIPICMSEEYWANSQLSIVRHFGEINFNGNHYIVVNKKGISVLELSNPKSKYFVPGHKVILPGEPCDLIHSDFQKYYRALGRESFLAVLKEYPQADIKTLKRVFKQKVGK